MAGAGVRDAVLIFRVRNISWVAGASGAVPVGAGRPI